MYSVTNFFKSLIAGILVTLYVITINSHHMKRFLAVIAIAALLSVSTSFAAKKSKQPATPPSPTATAFTRLLWDGEAPHPKVIRPDADGHMRAPVNIGDTAKIHVFLPEASKANGKAVVLCPGGAYLGLCMDYEGGDWAPFFNEQGIALIVLQYRLPDGTWQIPVEDVQEAIRTARRNAREWNLDPAKIGVGGSSAGGHLASTASTHFNAPVNADTVSCRPDFAILYYPVISFLPPLTHTDTRRSFLGPNFTTEQELLFSNELQVTPETPRTWLGYSHDDDLVPTPNGLRYYEALRENGVPASLHIYPTGGHGWGIRSDFRYRDQMLSDLRSWLASF